MKTSRHLTETPGVHERTSEIGDDKPETLARGASNFQTHHMCMYVMVLLPHIPRRNQRPMYKSVFAESSEYGSSVTEYSPDLQGNEIIPS